MIIGMVSETGCIRVLKETIALKEKGYEVILFSRHRTMAESYYDGICLYKNREDLYRALRNTRLDIIHVHNEPDWMVKVASTASDGAIPVIYDVHDPIAFHAEGNKPSLDDIEAFSSASAVIYPSEGCRKLCREIYKAELCNKPDEVIYSFVNKCFIPSDAFIVKNPAMDVFVYEGMITDIGTPRKADEEHILVDKQFHLGLFQSLVKQGFHVHIYPAQPMDTMRYELVGCIVYYPLKYPVLLNALRIYSLGFAGSFARVPLVLHAMPNKIFEYISQGVVPVVYNNDEAGEFLIRNNCGIVLKDIENVKEQLEQGTVNKIRENVLNIRHDFVMEDQVTKLENLYRKATGG